MTDYQPNMVLATKTFNVVGTRPIRHDGADKVTGAAKYGADYNPAVLLHGKVLRSPHAHALIRSIDTSAAESLPGVKAVVTNRDFDSNPSAPDSKIDLGESVASLKFLRDNVLASDKVLYKGHAVAAVAADSPNVAEEAVSLIKVDYQLLPAVLTAPEGAEEDASLLHKGLKTQEMGVAHGNASNVAKRFRHVLGDVEEGFAQADIDNRAGVQHEDRPSGLHRAPRLRRFLEPGRTAQHLVQHAGALRGEGHRFSDAGRSLYRRSGLCLWR